MIAEIESLQFDKNMDPNELSKAKDKLHDLLNNNPNDLNIRAKLGEVYWALDQPVTAGRYWFLIEADTPEMVAATYEFVNSCKNEPQEILRRIEFNGDVGELESEFAKYMLINLKGEAHKPAAIAQQTAQNQSELGDLILPLNYEKRSPVKRIFLWAGCITAMAVPIILLIAAAFGFGRWAFGFF